VSVRVNFRVDPTWKVLAPSCWQARSAVVVESVERRKSPDATAVATVAEVEATSRDRIAVMYVYMIC
jgi:hypothetical protein